LLAFLPGALFRPEQPARYVAIAWATSFFPSVLLSWFASQLLPDAAKPEFPAGSAFVFVLIVIVSPAIETLMMGVWIDVLRRWLTPAAAVITSAASWALFHSSMAAAWGLVIWWPFLIFSTAFVTWRHRLGFWGAAGLVACIHGLQNLPPAMLLLAHLD
jgi:hypothetical protein